MAKSDTGAMREWARTGAQARLAEIAAERAAIYREFPELRRRTGRAAIAEPAHDGAAPRARKRGRRKMSREARKRIAEAQRKRWAELKAKQSAGNGSSAEDSSSARASKKR